MDWRRTSPDVLKKRSARGIDMKTEATNLCNVRDNRIQWSLMALAAIEGQCTSSVHREMKKAGPEPVLAVRFLSGVSGHWSSVE
jgi:hypothetical protein